MFLTSKYNKLIFINLLVVLFFLMTAQVVLAIDAESTGLNTTAKKGFGDAIVTANNNGNLSVIIGKIVGVALSFLGIFFFVLIIIAGYMWMSSMGNEQAAGKAKDILLAAVIGLFIVLIAYAATRLISGIFTS